MWPKFDQLNFLSYDWTLELSCSKMKKWSPLFPAVVPGIDSWAIAITETFENCSHLFNEFHVSLNKFCYLYLLWVRLWALLPPKFHMLNFWSLDIRMWPHLEIQLLKMSLAYMRSDWSREGSWSNMTGVLINREFWAQTCTQGERQVKMKAEVRVMLL